MKVFYSIFLVLILSNSIRVYSQQTNINDYKYIIVPESYSFLNGKDKYQLNSLTRFLFKKYKFNAFNIAEGFPDDLNKNGCIALRVDLKKNSDFVFTKLSIQLKDCNGKIVFTSSEGISKEKEYKKAYQEALRGAFNDMRFKKYKYAAKNIENVSIDTTKVVQEIVQKPREDTITQRVYIYNDKEYVFKKAEYGYEIVENHVVIGKIIRATRDNTYIVQAGKLSGFGFFDTSSFSIERADNSTNKLVMDIFVAK